MALRTNRGWFHPAVIALASASLLTPAAIAGPASSSRASVPDECTPVDVIVRPCGPAVGPGLDGAGALVRVRYLRVHWSMP